MKLHVRLKLFYMGICTLHLSRTFLSLLQNLAISTTRDLAHRLFPIYFARLQGHKAGSRTVPACYAFPSTNSANWLTPQNRTYFEKSLPSLSLISVPCVNTEGSLQCWQKSINWSYPVPSESKPYSTRLTFKAISQNCEKQVLALSHPFSRVSTKNNSAPTLDRFSWN